MPIERLFLLIICLILTSIMLKSYINCECGRPDRPSHGSHSRRHTQRFKEDSIVTYFCNNSYRLVNDFHRVCKFGIWSGKPSICAKPIKDGLLLKKVLIFSDIIQEYNISDNYDDKYYTWKAIDEENCVSSYSLKPQNWTIILNKDVIVNYFTVKLQSDAIINKTNLDNNNIKAFVNKHRKCSFMKFNPKNELEFICDSLSALTSSLEEKDKKNTINLYFNLLFSSTLTICSLGLYRFPEDCGKVGVPLQMTIDDIDEDRELEASCEDGYELVGNPRLYCGSDGQWIGSPSCRPIVTCPLIIPFQKYDNNVIRIEYKNGFYFNRTLMAVNDTVAVHYCTKTNITRITNNNNTTFSRYLIRYNRQCDNGVWSEVETDCDTLLIDNGLIDNNLNDSSYSLIITMTVLVIIFCFLCALSFYGYKIKKKKVTNEKLKKRSPEPLIDKFDKSIDKSFRYSANRISDPFDDSVYAIVAEEKYDIINFEGNGLDLNEEYDDVETSTPFYLEIMPINNISAAHKNSKISS